MYFVGYQPFINLVVGGQKRHGDACHKLTYMIMDSFKDLGLCQPALATRIHNASPRKYLRKIIEVVKFGIGFLPLRRGCTSSTWTTKPTGGSRARAAGGFWTTCAGCSAWAKRS